MDYQQITCSLTGKNIKADRMYKIRNDDCIENIVSICYNCPFADSENPACINCYGTIAQNAIRQINEDTRRVKMETVEYRNNYCKVGDDYVEMMGKGTFINEPLVHFKTLPSALIISVGRYKIVTKTD